MPKRARPNTVSTPQAITAELPELPSHIWTQIVSYLLPFDPILLKKLFELRNMTDWYIQIIKLPTVRKYFLPFSGNPTCRELHLLVKKHILQDTKPQQLFIKELSQTPFNKDRLNTALTLLRLGKLGPRSDVSLIMLETIRKEINFPNKKPANLLDELLIKDWEEAIQREPWLLQLIPKGLQTESMVRSATNSVAWTIEHAGRVPTSPVATPQKQAHRPLGPQVRALNFG